uniref:Uncharacterized protein n=1 Tax=uncultured marine virus TaxID=186617 RepID=A0A0F7LA88_9VIRU|nr:hypothetical protein [uncultured marine virus]
MALRVSRSGAGTARVRLVSGVRRRRRHDRHRQTAHPLQVLQTRLRHAAKGIPATTRHRGDQSRKNQRRRLSREHLTLRSRESDRRFYVLAGCRIEFRTLSHMGHRERRRYSGRAEHERKTGERCCPSPVCFERGRRDQ